jgi:hypothetical protein
MKPVLTSLPFWFVGSFVGLVFASGYSARAVQVERTVTRDSPPAQSDAAASAPVAIESWTKPKSGWLYVLDVRPDNDGNGGHVWLVDPAAGEVMGSIRTSYHPDFALSPDGTRLYIASDTRAHSSEIAVIDTGSGTVLGGQELNDRVVPRVLPSFSSMVISRDGAVLWVLLKSTDGDSLAAVNATSGEILSGRVAVGNCGDGQFVSYPTASQVGFICPASGRLWMVRVDAKGKELDKTFGLLSWDRTLGVAEAFPLPRNDQMIAVVRGDGAIFQMHVVSRAFSPTEAHGGGREQVHPGSWPISPDGRIFLGYSRSADAYVPNTLADEFRVFNTSSWKKEGSIKTSLPFWSAAVSNDGKRLYALAPQEHYIMAFDTATMRQVRTINVGSMPALALVAP